MRWVTVQTEEGPRACGVWQGQYVDVNAADPEMPATVRELLELGQNGSAAPGTHCRTDRRGTTRPSATVAGAGARPAARSSASA